jgi:hypothetical protein
VPPFPEILEPLWRLYQDFEQGLAPKGMGPAVADWQDLQAFDQALGLELEPYEKQLLLQLSQLRASIALESNDAGQNKNRQRGE